jgi:hypothetical protein
MKYVILALSLFSISTVKSQVLDSTKYFVTEAIINNQDYSECYIEDGQFLSFYKNEDGDLGFLNSTLNGDEFSFGSISRLKSEKIEVGDTNGELITFCWHYHNSYDMNSGNAYVSIKRVFRENGMEFIIKIITKKLDVLIFSGYTNIEMFNKYINENSFNSNYLITKN